MIGVPIESLKFLNYPESRILTEDPQEAKVIVNLARKGYAVVDDVLYYERADVPNRCRVAIPKHLREQIITDHHDTVYTGAVQKMTHWYY